MSSFYKKVISFIVIFSMISTLTLSHAYADDKDGNINVKRTVAMTGLGLLFIGLLFVYVTPLDKKSEITDELSKPVLRNSMNKIIQPIFIVQENKFNKNTGYRLGLQIDF